MRFEVLLDVDVTLSSGLHPVRITLSHLGLSRVYDPEVECSVDCWDKYSCRVSDSDPLWIFKNEQIEAEMRRISGEIQEYMDECMITYMLAPTRVGPHGVWPSMGTHIEAPTRVGPHLQSTDGSGKEELTFQNLIDLKIKESVAFNTKRGYEYFKRYFMSRVPEDVRLSDIDRNFADSFSFHVGKDFNGRLPTLRLMIARFNGVCGYGVARGLMKNKISICRHIAAMTITDRNLSLTTIRSLYGLYRGCICTDNQLKKPKTMALSLFFLDVAFQGLSPVDMAGLKVGDLKFGRIHVENGECLEVVRIFTFRRKTGRPVRIVAWKDPISEVLDALIKDKDKNDYLLPCYYNKEYDDDKRKQNRLCNYFNKMSGILNRVIAEDSGMAESVGDRKVTYYFARHAFCNLVDSLDIPRNVIQSMVGHKTSVLERSYLRPVDESTQATVSRRLFTLLAK